MQDVVADLHVVKDLGGAEAGGAEQPRRPVAAGEQGQPAGQLELALGVDDPTDVRGVARASALEDLLTDRVELAADRLDILRRQARSLVAGLSLQSRHPCPVPLPAIVHAW